MTKKAQAETLVIVIAVLATAIVIGVIASSIYSESKEESVVELCRLSMLEVKKIGKSSIGIFYNAKINCPSHSEHYNFKNPEEYYPKISQNLEECWYKTLGKNSPIGEISYWPDKNICFVCSDFTLNQDISVAEEIEYMKSKNMLSILDTSWKSPKNPGEQYFVNVESKYLGPGIISQKYNRTIYPLTTLKKDENYVTLYTYFNQEWALLVLSVLNPLIVNYILPEEKVYFRHVMIMPEKDLQNLGCEIYYWEKENE